MKITNGEKLILWRQRRGLTQARAAEMRGVGVDLYRAWEKDLRCVDQPITQVQSLEPNEVFFILRLRSGLSQAQLADELSISRQWVIQMEAGKAPMSMLQRYWHGTGP